MEFESNNDIKCTLFWELPLFWHKPFYITTWVEVVEISLEDTLCSLCKIKISLSKIRLNLFKDIFHFCHYMKLTIYSGVYILQELNLGNIKAMMTKSSRLEEMKAALKRFNENKTKLMDSVKPTLDDSEQIEITVPVPARWNHNILYFYSFFKNTL